MLRFGLLICVCLFFLGCALLFAFGSAGSPCFPSGRFSRFQPLPSFQRSETCDEVLARSEGSEDPSTGTWGAKVREEVGVAGVC